MAVDHAGDNDSGECDPVCNLAQRDSGVTERRRDGVRPSIGVHHNANNEVECGICDLERVQSLREVL